MRLDLAWRSTDSVVFDLDAVGHGQIQAAAMLFGAMVDTAREPGRYPGVDDLTLPGPGERVTEQAVQKLLDLVDAPPRESSSRFSFSTTAACRVRDRTDCWMWCHRSRSARFMPIRHSTSSRCGRSPTRCTFVLRTWRSSRSLRI